MLNDIINTKKLKYIIKNKKCLKYEKNIYALGIDQGYANLGYAIVKYNVHTNTYKILKIGTIQTNSKYEIQFRIYTIYKELNKLIKKFNIDLISCERLFYNNSISSSGTKTRNKSASIVKTNMVTGVIFLLSAMHNLKLRDFPPTTIKKQLTGSGKADKEEIIKVVDDLCLKQNIKLKTNHESDAIAIAMTAISSYIENLLNE